MLVTAHLDGADWTIYNPPEEDIVQSSTVTKYMSSEGRISSKFNAFSLIYIKYIINYSFLFWLLRYTEIWSVDE